MIIMIILIKIIIKIKIIKKIKMVKSLIKYKIMVWYEIKYTIEYNKLTNFEISIFLFNFYKYFQNIRNLQFIFNINFK